MTSNHGLSGAEAWALQHLALDWLLRLGSIIDRYAGTNVKG